MRRALLAITLLAGAGAGCSGPARSGPGAGAGSGESAPPPKSDEAAPPGAADRDARVTRMCAKLLELSRSGGCGEPFELESCRSDWGAVSATSGIPEEAQEEFLDCVVAAASCDALGRCASSLQAAVPKPPEFADDVPLCDRRNDPFTPIRLTAAQAAARHGIDASRVDQVTSSPSQPIEVCGVEGQLDWLTRVTCPDGSQPFADASTAHKARVGNVGQAGRCKNHIDHYRVPCPDRTHDVYMDFYMCGPGEDF